MRLRFLAAVGPKAALRLVNPLVQRAAGSILNEIFDAPCMKVWAAPETPALIDRNRSAVLIGRLIERHTGTVLHELPQPVPADEPFVEAFWGAYVLLSNSGDTRHRVLRDPSGSVPGTKTRLNPFFRSAPGIDPPK